LPVSSDRTSLSLPVMIRMLGILAVEKRMRVLEVGCGNGLICALLSILGAEVFGVEKNASLIQRARKTLDRHHLEGVLVQRGSSASGWGECGPYDRILVSLPQRVVDPRLLNQLVPEKGRLVALEGDGVAVRLVLYEVSGGVPRKVTFEEVILQGASEVTEAAH
jgi:protein-L-isoaspartate(D-aspartate) O-methyltransferase